MVFFLVILFFCFAERGNAAAAMHTHPPFSLDHLYRLLGFCASSLDTVAHYPKPYRLFITAQAPSGYSTAAALPSAPTPRGTALATMTMAMTMPMVMMTMTMTVTTMTMTATTLLCFVPTAMATKYRRASHRVWHRKGARRGKAAAHNTVHSMAARSTAQIIKAANGVEHCQFIVQPSHRQARTIPWRSARLGG